MQGMHRETGKFIDGLEHLGQSIQIILSTPIGSRVMLPEFGSELVYLVDKPMTDSNQLRLYTATIDALQRWEPRIEVQQVQLIKTTQEGIIEISVQGIYENRQVNIPVTIGTPRRTTPETPTQPTVPTQPVMDIFVFGDNQTFIFDDTDTFGWN